jgi:hypothetical protein
MAIREAIEKGYSEMCNILLSDNRVSKDAAFLAACEHGNVDIVLRYIKVRLSQSTSS